MSGAWFWLSFADDDGFRGGCYVQADGSPHALFPLNKDPFVLAIGKAHELGINPGGQVSGFGPLPEDRLPGIGLRNVLLTKDDLKRIGGYVSTDGEDLK